MQSNSNPHLPLLRKLLLSVVAMFGFAFALVPLYDIFCDITGINGKPADTKAEASQQVDMSRTVTLEFITKVSNGMNWTLQSEVRRVKLHPGEMKKIAFFAKNLSQETQVAQAVPSVSPGQAALYLHKTQCFCFERQPLDAGKSAELPVILYLDPDLPEDVSTLTLAYTLYAIEEKVSETTEKNSVEVKDARGLTRLSSQGV